MSLYSHLLFEPLQIGGNVRKATDRIIEETIGTVMISLAGNTPYAGVTLRLTEGALGLHTG